MEFHINMLKTMSPKSIGIIFDLCKYISEEYHATTLDPILCESEKSSLNERISWMLGCLCRLAKMIDDVESVAGSDFDKIRPALRDAIIAKSQSTIERCTDWAASVDRDLYMHGALQERLKHTVLVLNHGLYPDSVAMEEA